MKFKFLSIPILLFGLAFLMLSSCGKENLDITTTEEEEVIPEVVTCDQWQMSITYDGNGNLSATIGGGTPPFDYLWSTGETNTNINVSQSGTYSLTVTDADGCVLVEEITISLNPACNGFSVDITEDPIGSNILVPLIVGGTMPYSYLWSTGETTFSINASIGLSYSVTVTDNNGCVVEDEVDFIVIVTCEPYDISIEESPIGSGSLSTIISGNVSGGPYEYFWSTGETTSSINVSESGIYSVIVTDINGCTCLLYTSPSPRDRTRSRMPSSA